MAASLSKTFQSQMLDDLLQCPICHQQFINPRVLKCQHAFCYECLEGGLKIFKEPPNMLQCAVCRKKTSLTKNGVSGLPKHFIVAGLLEMVKKQMPNSDQAGQSTSKPPCKTTAPSAGRTKQVSSKKLVMDKNNNLSRPESGDTSNKEYKRIDRHWNVLADDARSSHSDETDSDDYEDCLVQMLNSDRAGPSTSSTAPSEARTKQASSKKPGGENNTPTDNDSSSQSGETNTHDSPGSSNSTNTSNGNSTPDNESTGLELTVEIEDAYAIVEVLDSHEIAFMKFRFPIA